MDIALSIYFKSALEAGRKLAGKALFGLQAFLEVPKMSRRSESHGFEGGAVSSAPLRKRVAEAARGALAAIDAAVAGLLFWREVSRRIEHLLTLDDAALRRRGLDRSEIVPAVFRAARARRDRRRD
jgi:hypothetical protein